MDKININQEVIMYPTVSGWAHIEAIRKAKYMHIAHIIGAVETKHEYVSKHNVENGGYKDYLWEIMADYGDQFHIGSSFLKHVTLDVMPL